MSSESSLFFDDVSSSDRRGLTSLRLDHNGLTTLNPCVIKVIWSLRRVDISGNPLVCDCQLVDAKNWAAAAATAAETVFPGAQCAEPTSLAGQWLDRLALLLTYLLSTVY